MNLIKKISLLPFFLLAGCPLGHAQTAPTERLLYLGTYTGHRSHGIYTTRLDTSTGALSTPELAAPGTDPTFLAIAPSGNYLYAVNEISHFHGTNSGSASAFAIDKTTGHLTHLNDQPTIGTGPCQITLDHTGKYAFAANYGSGSLALLPINPDGTLGPPTAFFQHHGKSVNADRQSAPHTHCVTLDNQNHFAYACDLGLDQILSYRFDAPHGTLVPNDPPFFPIKPGSGPRHLAFSPSGKNAVLISEMASTVTTLEYNSRLGTFEQLQTISALPENFTNQSSGAEITYSPNGKTVYASNRGDDSIAVFHVDPRHGTLTFIQRAPTLGKTPRHFAIDPTGKYLLAENQDSDTIVVLAIARDGQLTPTGHTLPVGSPVCIQFLP